MSRNDDNLDASNPDTDDEFWEIVLTRKPEDRPMGTVRSLDRWLSDITELHSITEMKHDYIRYQYQAIDEFLCRNGIETLNDGFWYSVEVSASELLMAQIRDLWHQKMYLKKEMHNLQVESQQLIQERDNLLSKRKYLPEFDERT